MCAWLSERMKRRAAAHARQAIHASTQGKEFLTGTRSQTELPGHACQENSYHRLRGSTQLAVFKSLKQEPCDKRQCTSSHTAASPGMKTQ